MPTKIIPPNHRVFPATHPDNCIILTTCPFCKETNQLEMPEVLYFKGLDLRARGGLIQTCFPTLTAQEREQLLTGICCFWA
jgi:hypothetical protein